MAKFIGGCADGQDIVVNPGMHRVSIPVQPTFRYAWDEPPSIEHERVKIDTYHRERIRGGTKDFVVFVEDSVEPDMMIAKLIEGYQPVDLAEVHKQLLSTLKMYEALLTELAEECIEAGVRPAMMRRADELRAMFKALKERYGLE